MTSWAGCLESGIKNVPQNNIGIVPGIELLVLWKREHDMEIHSTELDCDHDLSVLQSMLRFGRGFFAGPKPHMISSSVCPMS
jgi:hypothetical protein